MSAPGSQGLWIDDLRKPPHGWDWARSLSEAREKLAAREYPAVSFDHDLGGDETTRPIILMMCETGRWPSRVHVHSANPVGVEWLVGMIDRYGPGATPRRES